MPSLTVEPNGLLLHMVSSFVSARPLPGKSFPVEYCPCSIVTLPMQSARLMMHEKMLCRLRANLEIYTISNGENQNEEQSHHLVREILRKLVERRGDITAYNILKCKPHEANYSQKKYTTPEPIKMYLSTAINLDSAGVFILDNVICTGVTASAALEVLPDATVVALAMSSWR